MKTTVAVVGAFVVALRRLVRACAHELRTGLNSVAGWGEQVPAMYFAGWPL